MFDKKEFKNLLRLKKSFTVDKFNVIVGNRTTFSSDDIIPAIKEMGKDCPSALPKIIFKKSAKHVPEIKNGAISFEDFSNYVEQCAADRGQYFDKTRLRKLLMRSSWMPLRVTDEPLTLQPIIITRVSEILAGI